ncbi:hypothetical protein OH76DRAFT_467649 [Lentinus brumalis]|uniref:Uncharacterized protein n=1 Tax=Lentinus brumalis TaxID=2498619 RepID=A0A371DCL0_9APHY|nr:hypothetical protein OH76DRAFT_467649 [Polyporus brumalis]
MVVVRGDRASSLPDGQFLLDAVERDARLTGEHMSKSRAEVEEVLRGRIERARAQTRKCHGHAEAGLIALEMHLRKTENTDTALRRVADVFAQQNALPIGTSKKCCWACYRLSELLQQGANVHREFILPGSRGVIYP